MSRAIIHVNRSHIAANTKDGGRRPVYTIKQAGRTTYAHGVELEGRIRLVDPRVTKPLPCGARAWIEVLEGEIRLTDPCSFAEAREQVLAAA